MTFRVTWRHRSRDPGSWAISYRCSIGTDTLSPFSKGFRDIQTQIYLVTVLTFLGHLTSSVTWSFFPQCAVSNRCSIDTNLLSWAVYEILSLKHIWVATWTFRITWHQQSRDCSLAHGPCLIGVPLVQTLQNLQGILRLRLNCIWVTVLTFLGHVTSSVTWSFFLRYVVSYRWSVDTS